MIQRVQSLCLFAAFLISVFFLNGALVTFDNAGTSPAIEMRFSGLYSASGTEDLKLVGSILPVTIISVLIPLISFFAIFLFRRRKLQLRMVSGLIIMEILLLGLVIIYMLITTRDTGLKVAAGAKSLIPLLSIILYVIAYRKISEDEELVKSSERLR
jgi:hypothetical protein